MKTFFRLFLLLMLTGFQAVAMTSEDSIVVHFGKSGKIVVLANSKEDAEVLRRLDLNKIVQALRPYMDSASRSPEKRLEIRNADGTYVITIEGEDIELERRRVLDFSPKRKNIRKHANFIQIDVGLNGFMQDGQVPSGTAYDLRPLGSRYVSLGWQYRRILSKNPENYTAFQVGAAVSWYNFMFEGNRRVRNGDTGEPIFFTETNVGLSKTKLTVAYLDIPVMLQLGKAEGLRFGVGGYVGYRIGSYTKIKHDDRKEHNHGGYGLSPFRYGLRVELGHARHTPRVFASYDLNPLFQSSNAPQLNAFAFGVRIAL